MLNLETCEFEVLIGVKLADSLSTMAQTRLEVWSLRQSILPRAVARQGSIEAEYMRLIGGWNS